MQRVKQMRWKQKLKAIRGDTGMQGASFHPNETKRTTPLKQTSCFIWFMRSDLQCCYKNCCFHQYTRVDQFKCFLIG